MVQYLDIGTKVRINLNYLKEFLKPGEFESHKQYNVIGTIIRQYLIENEDFYEVFWDDGKTEGGFNRAFLQEIYDINFLLKELL